MTYGDEPDPAGSQSHGRGLKEGRILVVGILAYGSVFAGSGLAIQLQEDVLWSERILRFSRGPFAR